MNNNRLEGVLPWAGLAAAIGLWVLWPETQAVWQTVIGCCLTIIVSRRYYMKAGTELQDEAKTLRRKVNMVLEGLADAKLISPVRDSTGEIVSVPITLQGRSATDTRSSVDITVKS